MTGAPVPEGESWLHRWLDTARRTRMPRVAVWHGEIKVAKGKGPALLAAPCEDRHGEKQSVERLLARLEADEASGARAFHVGLEGDVLRVRGLDWRERYEDASDAIEPLLTAAAALGGKGSVLCLAGLGRVIRDRKPASWGAERWVKWSAKAGACEIEEGERSNEKKVLEALEAVFPTFDAWITAHPDARERMEHREEYGYVDRSGRVVLAPTLVAASEMGEGLASVVVGRGERRVVDREGRTVMEGIVNARVARRVGDRVLFPFSVQGEGNQQPWGYADASGAVCIAPTFYDAEPFDGPLALVRTGTWITNEQRWLAPSGELVGDAFDYTTGFAEGRAWVFSRATLEMRCIDERGRSAHDVVVGSAGRYAGGLAAAAPKGTRTFGYVDLEGRWAIEPRFDQAHPFADDRAVVSLGGEAFVIDREGTRHGEAFAVAPLPFSGGLLAAAKDGRTGFLDREGRWAIPPRFVEAHGLFEGLAYASIEVGRDVRWGHLDASGTWVIAPTLEWTNRFVDGLAPARRGGLFGFVDREGRWVIEPRWKSTQPSFTDGLAWVQLP